MFCVTVHWILEQKKEASRKIGKNLNEVCSYQFDTFTTVL